MTPLSTSRKTTLVRSGLIGLAVVATVGELGCSHLRSRSRRSEPAPAMLGSELPGRDIYAKAPPEGSELGMTREALAAARAQPPAVAEVIPPPPTLDNAPVTAAPMVQLQPPVSVDRSKLGTVPTTIGVPDATRLLAMAPRPEVVAPKLAAPTLAPTTQVISEARASLSAMSSYQLSLQRQERVNGELLPAEALIMSIHRQPKAARLTWAEGPHTGREVLYRSDEPGGMMHVNMADSKLPIPRLALAPDSPMVMKNSRHPITEAGLDPIIASMEEADRAGTLVDLGMQTPAPLDHPVHGILRKTAEGDVWRAYFDPANHLPALVECQAGNGELLERYVFENIQPDPPELATMAAFDPDARWGPPRGLFGRMSAKAGDLSTAPTTR